MADTSTGGRQHAGALLLVVAVLLVSLSITPARGAVPEMRTVGFRDLKPITDDKDGHAFYYQVPENPRAVAAFFHACVHSGYNYWPNSPDCPDCRGLPEELSHTLQALRLGYAVIAISSKDREVGCWSWNDDGDSAASVLKGWLNDWGLQDLPLYGVGISSGASFALKMPRNVKFDGVVSEALGVDPLSWGFEEAVGGQFPPTVYVNMERDVDTAVRIQENVAALEAAGTPVYEIKVQPRRVYPTYFSDRDAFYINQTFSREIAQGLFNIQMIDRVGNVIEDPRYSGRPWMADLQQKVPALRGSGAAGMMPKFPDQQPQDVVINGVWSLMNLAYAQHEIISDYTTAAFLWFESFTDASMPRLLEQYTYGTPPDINFTYSHTGPVTIIEPGPAAITNSSITNSTLPGCSRQYTVRPGDFCFYIASSMGMELDYFMAMNTALNCTEIQPGDFVCVKAAPKPPPPPRPSPSPPPKPSPPPAVVPSPPTSVPIAGTVDGSAANAPPTAPPSGDSSDGGLSAGAQAGIAAGCTILGVALAAVAFVMWRRKCCCGAAAAGAQPDELAKHESFGANAKLSIIPGVKERFDLTEVVEASGSPGSARRRHRTTFNGSPQQSPTKRRGAAPASGL